MVVVLFFKGDNDFKLEEFLAGTPETFEPHYGKNQKTFVGYSLKCSSLGGTFCTFSFFFFFFILYALLRKTTKRFSLKNMFRQQLLSSSVS